ncbi:hypothetical protein [Streptomyces sp. NPDC006335]|uniref:hypothetical protein n=1 Tax=Streptomyces sp. NPDC006335 TaxID=3156895 RepID=UPI0033AEBB12
MDEQRRQELLDSLPDDPVNAERPPESLQQKADRIASATGHSTEDDITLPSQLERLADQLARQYDYRPLTELEQEDPERAQEHRDAAAHLAPWIQECPREERRAAFGRGFDKGKERQKLRTAGDVQRLKGEVAELRQDRDPDGLRARIRDLEYALEGWDRFMTGRVLPDAPADWKAQATEYLAKLIAVQRELAVLKGVQPSNATRSSSS